MAKREYIDMSESGNWNVADPYTKIKIMQPLALVDEYERIAIFGTSDILEEFTITPELMKHARVKALKRMCHELLLLCDNTQFAMKKPEDKIKMGDYKTFLKRIWKVLPEVFEIKRNSVDKSKDNKIGIDEEKFEGILDMLSNIKSDINTLLNNADLIFTSTEEFDPRKLKEKIITDIIESG